MKAEHYTYHVTWSEEDNEFVGLCDEFPSLSWLEAKREAALAGMMSLVELTLADMAANGEPLPKPSSRQKFSVQEADDEEADNAGDAWKAGRPSP